MGAKLNNNAYGTLLASISNTATSITLSTGNGAKFPTLSTGEYFYATLIDVNNNLEIVKVTARVSDVLTVVRGQDGTTARAFLVGDRIEQRLVTALFNEKADYVTPGTAGNVLTSTGTGWVSSPPKISSTVPATSTSTGVAGTVAFDSTYVYVCVATNSWKRIALQTW